MCCCPLCRRKSRIRWSNLRYPESVFKILLAGDAREENGGYHRESTGTVPRASEIWAISEELHRKEVCPFSLQVVFRCSPSPHLTPSNQLYQLKENLWGVTVQSQNVSTRLDSFQPVKSKKKKKFGGNNENQTTIQEGLATVMAAVTVCPCCRRSFLQQRAM